MMARSSILIQVALVLLATSLTCDCFVDKKDYLDFPVEFSRFDGIIANTLQKIVIKEYLREFHWWEEITKAIKKGNEDAVNLDEKQVYADLVQLQSGDFSGRALDTFLSISAQVDRDSDDAQVKPLTFVKRYLSTIAKDHLQWQSQEVIKRAGSNLDSKAVNELNEVFAAAFGMKGGARLDSRELAAKLSKFDLATDDSFNAKQMMKAIRKRSTDKSTKDNFELLKMFMLERCERLMKDEDLRRLIIDMDIVRYTASSKSFNDIHFHHSTFRQVDEYNRLCLALKNRNKSALIKDNLNERLQHGGGCF